MESKKDDPVKVRFLEVRKEITIVTPTRGRQLLLK
jgi:hypothetical protein